LKYFRCLVVNAPRGFNQFQGPSFPPPNPYASSSLSFLKSH